MTSNKQSASKYTPPDPSKTLNVMSPRAFVLVDFHNFYHDFLVAEHELDRLIRQFSMEFNSILTMCAEYVPHLSEVVIRFYGGWNCEGEPTKHSSTLLSVISESMTFPVTRTGSGSPVRGSVELATSLLSVPRATWHNTLKRSAGLPRLRLDRSRLPTEYRGAESTSFPPILKFRFESWILT